MRGLRSLRAAQRHILSDPLLYNDQLALDERGSTICNPYWSTRLSYEP